MHRTKIHVHHVDDKYAMMIASDLRKGPVALGERHTDPHARAMLKKLINAAVVRQLFVEVPNIGCNPGLELASQTRDVTPVADDITHAGARVYKFQPADRDLIMKNIIVFAIKNGVEVHLFDVPEMTESEMRSNQGMIDRDIYMADYYHRYVKDGGVGAVLLNGAKHLSSKGGYSTRSLAARCGISRMYQFFWDYEGKDLTKATA